MTHGRRTRNAHDDKGFTLVELVVVVVILGVLAGIAVPVVISQSRTAAFHSDIAAIAAAKVAVNAYMTEVGGGTTEPTDAQLDPYGWPTEPLIGIASYDSVVGTFTLDIDKEDSSSQWQCQATQSTAPFCFLDGENYYLPGDPRA